MSKYKIKKEIDTNLTDPNDEIIEEKSQQQFQYLNYVVGIALSKNIEGRIYLYYIEDGYIIECWELIEDKEGKEDIVIINEFIDDLINDFTGDENRILEMARWGRIQEAESLFANSAKFYRILEQQFFYNNCNPIDYLKNELDNIIEFNTKAEAERYIQDIEAVNNENYYLSLSEATLPSYFIIPMR